jgi:hypothetical protein
MHHKNYFEITAKSNYELGVKEGLLFGEQLRDIIRKKNHTKDWRQKVKFATKFLAATKKSFPKYIEELEGYSKGADSPFLDLWALSLEDDLTAYKNKCTTMVTNNGFLIGHNEDWDPACADKICILKKRIKKLIVFEIFYLNTLGGNAISINSHGIIQTINSQHYTDGRTSGVPKNVIARWISEAYSPEKSFNILKSIDRSSAFTHNLINLKGKITSIETTACRQNISKPESPFIHTNHYLNNLKKYENKKSLRNSFERYRTAENGINPRMSVKRLSALMRDKSKGKTDSIFNKKTIAQVIIDTKKMQAHIWLKRENKLGWITYDLGFINK